MPLLIHSVLFFSRHGGVWSRVPFSLDSGLQRRISEKMLGLLCNRYNVFDVLSVAVRHKKGLLSSCDWVKDYFPGFRRTLNTAETL